MSNPQHEPTMEEILASIRKIISEDAPETAAAPAPASASPPPAPAAPIHEDILELTQEVEAPAPAPVPPPPPPAPPPPEDLIFQSVTATPAAPEHADIFSDRTRKAMEDTFNSIPDEPEEPVRPQVRNTAPIGPVDGSTVENVFERAVRESFEPVLQKYLSDNSTAVIDRMKPLIREWMDEHFPALLEGAVRAEVERVVKARGSKR
jgi:cell pole-organizing protein PopZ